jgi:integrase
MRKRGRAAATVNLQLATLRKALRLAHEHCKLEKLPVVRMLRPAPPRAGFFEREAFEEVAAVLPVDLALAVRIGYTFGWRINSEVLSLIWRQVDFEAGTLRLELGTTKNREGRLVFLTPALREGLAAQRARARALERELGAIIPHVFPVPDGRWKGKPRRSFTWTWRRACREAGRPGMLAHDLRRTAARNMVHLGVPERVVMAVMGHKTRSMLDRYCIVSPGDLREATERLTNADNSRTIQAHAGDD